MNESNHQQRGSNLIVFILAALVALPLVYVGSYAALVERDDSSVISVSMPNGARSNLVVPAPKYAVGGEGAAVIFEPVHFLDCKIRPWHWCVAVE
jgi:hypothetical protein